MTTENQRRIVRAPLKKKKRADLWLQHEASPKPSTFYERMKIMATHVSATAREETGERIADTFDFSKTLDADEDDPSEEKIEALAEMICRAGNESAAALLVLMGTLQNSTQPKVLANTAKHLAFTRCGELNVYDIVDAQIAMLKNELLAAGLSL